MSKHGGAGDAGGGGRGNGSGGNGKDAMQYKKRMYNGRVIKPVLEKTKSVAYVANGTDSNQLLSISKTDTSTTTPTSDPKFITLTNTGDTPVVTLLGYEGFSSETTDVAVHYLHVLLKPGEILEPPMRGIIPTANQLHLMDGEVLDWTDPADRNSGNLYIDSGVDVQEGTGDDIVGSATTTKLLIEQFTNTANHGVNLFRVGDLVRVNNEIMEVTALGSAADDANNYLTVIRGVYGSTAASDHADDAEIRFPFFNAASAKYDRYTTCQTNARGDFTTNNMFFYGRNQTDIPTGIMPGSFCLIFWEAGYQDLTNDGDLTLSTETGLTAGDTYYLSLSLDGKTTDKITFTVDADNTTLGSSNGIITKLQAAADALFYNPAKNNYETGCTFSLVNGNLRCTSNQYLSTSAVSITTNTDGTAGTDELFDGSNIIGRFPATIPPAVAARIPDKTLYNSITYATSPNKSVMAYDTGDGRIVGAAKGSINYETGKWSIISAKPNANFEYSVAYNSPFSGMINSDTTSNRANQLIAVHVNVLNKQLEGEINLKVY